MRWVWNPSAPMWKWEAEAGEFSEACGPASLAYVEGKKPQPPIPRDCLRQGGR